MITTRHRPETIWNRYNFPVSMEGCVLYLPLWQEDMRGSTIYSYDRSVTACSVTGTVMGSQGRTLNGTSDFIDCGTAINPRAELTVIAWVKPTDVTASGNITSVVSKDDDASNRQIRFGIAATQKVRLVSYTTVDGASTTTSTGTLTQGVAAHIGFVISSAAGFQGNYLNGVLDGGGAGTLTVGTLLNNVTPVLYIGKEVESPWYYGGLIGEVWIYSRAFSAGEMAYHRLQTMWRYA